jgi:glycogen operon protein
MTSGLEPITTGDGSAKAEGNPLPLGAHWIAQDAAFNFSLYAPTAQSVELLVYAAADVVNPVLRVAMNYKASRRNRTWAYWHCRVSGADVEAKGGAYYAYRVSGPAPERFNAQKILFDPYARALFFPPTFDSRAAIQAGPNDGKAPLGVMPKQRPTFDWGADRPPRHGSDLIIYEMHVRGFTMQDTSIAAAHRGTFAGVVDKIAYLQKLGITAVELMPVFQTDPHDGNYWGYMPLSFFAPSARYASAQDFGAQLDEFRGMVKALHAAGIEVFLDVVYNHTSEGNEQGPTFSYRGLSEASYYLLNADHYYLNESGTGNTMQCSHPAVRKLILDSMRFWVEEAHVDGFRFDLATILTLDGAGTASGYPPLIDEIEADPTLTNVRLIAEPWDADWHDYELGPNFPGHRWSQWNGAYRDSVRSFVKSDEGFVNELIQRIYGSNDLFPDDSNVPRVPEQSINFVTCHDGFCLYDLVAYNDRHNEANGEGNADGPTQNFSWNCGFEGDSGVPADVVALRKRQIKNFMTILMVSNGTPMFGAGDEILHTQHGNNNPYNQDNASIWLDWSLYDKNADMFRFFQRIIAFRKQHPSIGRGRFWYGDVQWFGTQGDVDRSAPSHTLAFYLDGRAAQDADLYVMINAYWQDLTFRIQMGNPGDWRKVVDTAQASPNDAPDDGAAAAPASSEVQVGARSVVVFVRART